MVNNLLVNRKEEQPRISADIFRAAAMNDPAELKRALADGQNLDLVDEETGLTPIIVGLLEYSQEFLAEAIKEKFDPWYRDPNERLAIDHANALKMRDIQKALFLKMYPRHG